MKISKHVILTSLMGLLVSTAYTMDENAVVGHVPVGQHAAAQIRNIDMVSWDDIMQIQHVNPAAAAQLKAAMVADKVAKPIGMVSWDDIMQIQHVNPAAADQLRAAMVAEKVAGPIGMVSWDDIMQIRHVNPAAAAQLKAAKIAAEVH